MTKRKTPGDAGGYDVGYRKPPKTGQFKKGQSRPPRKPKQPQLVDFAGFILEELTERIRFNDEDGKELLAPKGKYLAKMVVNQALKTGNLKQLNPFLPKANVNATEDLSEADLALIARALAKLGLGGGQGDDA